MAITTTIIPVGTIATHTSTGDTAVTFMSLCNHGLVAVTCSIHVVPNGDGATNDNLLMSALAIPAGDTFILYQGGEKLILGNGDRIMVTSDTATVTAVTSSVAI